MTWESQPMGVKYELMVCPCWGISTSWAGWGGEWGALTHHPRCVSPGWVGHREMGDPIVAHWAVVTNYSWRGSHWTSEKKKIARSIVQCQNRVPVGRWSLCSWEFSCLGYTKPQVTRSSMAIVLLCVGDWRRPLWCSLLNKNISEAFWWCLEGLRWMFFWHTMKIHLWLMHFIVI